MDTELVSLQLTGSGFTLNAGDGTANGLCDGPLCSLGRITEQAGNPLLADSFFDVNFEILGTPFGRLHNDIRDPCTMEAVINRVPPPVGTTYICNPDDLPIDLLDDNGNIQGQLLSASHTPNHVTPEPSTLLLLSSGLVGIIGLGIRRKRSLKT